MNGVSDGLWLAIGWTMLHFLWIGGLIAVVAALVLRALRGASAEVRHVAALTSLAMLAAAPAAIAWRASPGIAPGGLLTQDVPDEPGVRILPPAIPRRVEETPGIIVPGAIASADVAIPAVAASPRTPVLVGSRLDVVVARLPWIWLAGSPITFAWLALGLAGAERLRRGAAAVDGELSILCGRLSGELGIARAVAVGVCDRLAAPVLVGVVRPMILLPASALSGWAPDQLEMIGLHELAHVRRRDNLVNLLQRAIESALFFHPAVWVVSGWVRREREHCCDAIVVAHTGRARAYAETLLAMAGTGSGRTPRAAVAMARNDLVARVGRILHLEPKGHAMKLPRGLLALTAAALIVPAGWTASLAQLDGAPGKDDQAAKPDQADAEIDPRALLARAAELAEAVARDRGARRERFHVLLDLADDRAHGGDRAGAVALLHRAGEAIKELPDGIERIVAASWLAGRLARAGRADEAIALASSLGADTPEAIRSHDGALGQVTRNLAADGHVAKAIEASRLIIDKAARGDALGSIAVAQDKQGDRAAALRTVESIAKPESRIRVLAGRADSRMGGSGLAVSRGRAGDREGAAAYLDRARELTESLPDEPKKDEARASLALAVAQLGDLAEGSRRVRALGDSKIRATAIAQLGVIQAEAGDDDAAYRTARSISDPEARFVAIWELGMVQRNAGKFDESQKTFRKLLESDLEAMLRTNNAHLVPQVQIYAGDIPAAMAAIERMGGRDPGLYSMLVEAMAQDGDFEATRTFIAERIPNDDDKAGAYVALAYFQAKAGQEKEALRWADALGHRRHRSQALIAIARALAERRGLKLEDLQAPAREAAPEDKGGAEQAKPGPTASS